MKAKMQTDISYLKTKRALFVDTKKNQLEKYGQFFLETDLVNIENIEDKSINITEFDLVIFSQNSSKDYNARIKKIVEKNSFISTVIYVNNPKDNELEFLQILNLSADGYFNSSLRLTDILNTFAKAIEFKAKIRMVSIDAQNTKNSMIEELKNKDDMKDLIYDLIQREKRLNTKADHFMYEVLVDSKLNIINMTRKFKLTFRAKQGDNFINIITGEHRNYFLKQVLVSIRNKNESLFDTFANTKDKENFPFSCEIEPFIEKLEKVKEFRITLDPLIG